MECTVALKCSWMCFLFTVSAAVIGGMCPPLCADVMMAKIFSQNNPGVLGETGQQPHPVQWQ